MTLSTDIPRSGRRGASPWSVASLVTVAFAFVFCALGLAGTAAMLCGLSANAPTCKEAKTAAVGSVAVHSDPAGASVHLNGGEALGTTPFVIKGVEPDKSHTIKVVADGHSAEQYQVAVGAGQTLQLHATLVGLPSKTAATQQRLEKRWSWTRSGAPTMTSSAATPRTSPASSP